MMVLIIYDHICRVHIDCIYNKREYLIITKRSAQDPKQYCTHEEIKKLKGYIFGC